jgi:prepilin-type N-terminal cleavage/methylation domain-containing protein
MRRARGSGFRVQVDIPNNQTEETPLRHRKGFTMLEMLVVIGVILLLVTIAVAAYSKMVNAMAVKATATNLENCRSMLAEFEQVTPMTGMGYFSGQPDPNFPYLGGYFYNAADVKAGVTLDKTSPIDAADPSFAGVVTPPNRDQAPTRYPATTDGNQVMPPYMPATTSSPKPQTNAVYNTACVMMYLARVPNIGAELKKLPSKSFLLDPNGNPIVLNNAGQSSPAPVMVDGWGNPIIFVPANGLKVFLTQGNSPKYVYGATPANFVVRTSGTYDIKNLPPLKQTDRPFWAAAGPDANFATGDDNVYSFKQ